MPRAAVLAAVAALALGAALAEGRDAPGARAAQASSGVRLVKVGTFTAPVFVTAPPGDRRRVMVVEQSGRIMVLRRGRRLARPFLDISDRVLSSGEQGLLSLAFAPDYSSSGRFYVYYTDRATGDNRVVELRRGANADTASPSSARLVLSMPDLEPNHNGGLLMFGPDRLLYVGTGDGGGGNDQHGARGRRSTRTGCATRGGSRSTGGRATSRSATSARGRSRRSTSRAAAARAGRTSAGGRGRGGSAPSTSRRPAPSSRRSRTPTRRASARSPAATSCVTARCRA